MNKANLSNNYKYIILFAAYALPFLYLLLGTTVSYQSFSVEIGLNELSPRGIKGGYAIPASGDSECCTSPQPPPPLYSADLTVADLYFIDTNTGERVADDELELAVSYTPVLVAENVGEHPTWGGAYLGLAEELPPPDEEDEQPGAFSELIEAYKETTTFGSAAYSLNSAINQSEDAGRAGGFPAVIRIDTAGEPAATGAATPRRDFTFNDVSIYDRNDRFSYVSGKLDNGPLATTELPSEEDDPVVLAQQRDPFAIFRNEPERPKMDTVIPLIDAGSFISLNQYSLRYAGRTNPADVNQTYSNGDLAAFVPPVGELNNTNEINPFGAADFSRCTELYQEIYRTIQAGESADTVSIAGVNKALCDQIGEALGDFLQQFDDETLYLSIPNIATAFYADDPVAALIALHQDYEKEVNTAYLRGANSLTFSSALRVSNYRTGIERYLNGTGGASGTWLADIIDNRLGTSFASTDEHFLKRFIAGSTQTIEFDPITFTEPGIFYIDGVVDPGGRMFNADTTTTQANNFGPNNAFSVTTTNTGQGWYNRQGFTCGDRSGCISEAPSDRGTDHTDATPNMMQKTFTVGGELAQPAPTLELSAFTYERPSLVDNVRTFFGFAPNTNSIVRPPESDILYFTPGAGDRVGLVWEGANVNFTSCTGSSSDFNGQPDPITAWNDGSLVAELGTSNYDGDIDEPTIRNATDYTITCRGANGEMISDSVTVSNGAVVLVPTLPDMEVPLGTQNVSVPYAVENRSTVDTPNFDYELTIDSDTFTGTDNTLLPATQRIPITTATSWEAAAAGDYPMEVCVTTAGMAEPRCDTATLSVTLDPCTGPSCPGAPLCPGPSCPGVGDNTPTPPGPGPAPSPNPNPGPGGGNIDITADPALIRSGDDVNVTWDLDGNTNCVVTGSNELPTGTLSGDRDENDPYVISPSNSTTLILTCGSYEDTAPIRVLPILYET